MPGLRFVQIASDTIHDLQPKMIFSFCDKLVSFEIRILALIPLSAVLSELCSDIGILNKKRDVILGDS